MRNVIYRCIPGQPQQKGSKRGFKCGEHINIVDTNSKKAKAYEKAIADEFRTTVNDELHLGAVEVEIVFGMKRGKTVKRKEPTVKPDIDKMIRCVLDALTGIIYKDDCQVIDIKASKQYADAPATLIRVAMIEE